MSGPDSRSHFTEGTMADNQTPTKLTDLVVDNKGRFLCQRSASERRKSLEDAEARAKANPATAKTWAEREAAAWKFYHDSVKNSDLVRPGATWIMPFDGPITVTSPFQPRYIDVHGDGPQFHSGVDFGVKEGTSLLAVAGGTVTNAERMGAGGLTVKIDHGDGFTSIYCHCHETLVQKGDRVTARHVIAKSGGNKGDPNAGTSTGAHLHFGVLYKNKFADPVAVYAFFEDTLEYACPFDAPGAAANLWKNLANNEGMATGIGGYYVIGLNRNLHDGIHLYAPGPGGSAQVRCMAPGYVVAARLPGDDSPALFPETLRHIGAWPGMVIVRREISDQPDDDTAPRKALYSLYMHLQSPKYPAKEQAAAAMSAEKKGQAKGKPSKKSEKDKPKDDPEALIPGPTDAYFKDVPWFRSLVERRHGAFVYVLDETPSHPKKGQGKAPIALGTMVWAAEKVETGGSGAPNAEVYACYGNQGQIEVHKTVAGEKKLAWLYKPSPAQIVKCIDALATGSVATFGEPLLRVGAGENLGFVSPLAEPLALPTRVGGRPLQSGFLHWQVFAVTGEDDGAKLLVDLAKQIASEKDVIDASLPKPQAAVFKEVSDKGKPNFLDHQDLAALKAALPDADAAQFGAFFDGLDDDDPTDAYARDVIDFFNRASAFSPEPASPDWEAGCKYGYPVLLQIESRHLPSPDKNALAGAAYELRFSFESYVNGNYEPLACLAACDQASCGKPGATRKNDGTVNGSGVCAPPPLRIDAGKFAKTKTKDGVSLLTLSLRVPAAADRLKVKLGPGIVGEAKSSPQGADLVLMADALKERFRNVRMVHASEWSAKVFDGISQKIDKQVDIDPDVDDLAWLDAEKEVPIALTPLAPADEGFSLKSLTAKRFFGGLDDISNLHPVTAVWLLNLLKKARKLRVADDFKAPDFKTEDPAPMAVSWVPPVDAPSPDIGDHVSVLVVDDDFGYDKTNEAEIVAEGPKTLPLYRGPYGTGGNLVVPVDVCFWGDWTASSKPKPKSAKELYGTRKLSIPPLRLVPLSDAEKKDGLDRPHRMSDGTFRFVIKTNRPIKSLDGIVALQVGRPSSSGPSWADASGDDAVVVPSTATGIMGSLEDWKGALSKPELLIIEDGCIVGVDEKAVKAQNLTSEKVAITEGLTIGDYLRASTGIRVACALVDALDQLATALPKESLAVTSVAVDGLSLVVHTAKPPKLKRDAEPPLLTEAKKLTGLAASEPSPPGGGGKAPVPPTRGPVVLTVDPAAAKPIKEYPSLQKAAPAIVTTDSDRFIVACATQQLTDKVKLETVAGAYHRNGVLRVRETLARALHCLRKAGGKFIVSNLSWDGACCEVTSGDPKSLCAHALACGYFMAADAHGKAVTLMPLTDPEHSLVVTLRPAPFYAYFARRTDLEPRKPYPYRFVFETLNGLHYLAEPNDLVPRPFQGDVLGRKSYDKLAPRSAEKLTFRPTAQAGIYRRVAFGAIQFTWGCVGSASFLHLDVQLLGEADDWSHYLLKVSENGKPLKGFDKLKPKDVIKECGGAPNDRRLSAHISVHVNDSKNAATTYTIEAMPVDSAGPVDPITGSFDYKPRWKSTEIHLDASSGRLEIRCATEAVELPTFSGKSSKPNDSAREFEITVTMLADATGAPPKKPVLVHVEYAHPSARKLGCLDAAGQLLASVPTSAPAAPDSAALQPGATYRITVKRPWKIRGVDMDPTSLTTQYTCPTP